MKPLDGAMIKSVMLVVALFLAAMMPAFADPLTDVKAASVKFAALKSYRSTIIEPDGRTMQGEMVNPDRSHMTAGSIQIISIGDAIYIKTGGAWKKGALAAMSTGQRAFQKLYGNLPPTAVVRDLGMKTVDGNALHAYFVQASPKDQASTIYIDGGGMPSRFEAMDPSGTTVVHLYDFNAPISIVAPL